MGVWADEEDVYDVTGKEATPESLALAHTMVELFTGATPEATDAGMFTRGNLRKLQRATAFQAVWLDDHPDVLSVMDVEGVSQDGLSAQYLTANAHLLAPLAQRFIARLSWMRKGLRVRPPSGPAGNWANPDRGNRDSAVRDDNLPWSPLPFGQTPGGYS